MPRQLLNEKYRPTNFDEYVFQNEETKRKIMKWVNEKEIPNILLSGKQGCGKSTCWKILVNEMDLDPNDVKIINASIQNKIDDIRELYDWVKRSSFSSFKVVILEEMNRFRDDAAKALLDLTETYSDTVRFIGTTNYTESIIPPLLSRFQHIHFDEMNEDAIVEHIADILDAENITFNDENDVLSHIDLYGSDLRKIINSIDEHTDENNVLWPVSSSSTMGVDAEEWLALWKSKGDLDIDAALRISKSVDQSNFEHFYQIMYENHHKFPDAASGIVLVSKYLDRAYRCASQPLHLDACLYEVFVL